MKVCPNDLGLELKKSIGEVARLWFHSPFRPNISPNVSKGWSVLLQEWTADKSLPILVRKLTEDAPAGSVIIHSTGRALVPTDNSPASWVFNLAEQGFVPTLSDIHEGFKSDRIPVAMAIKKKHKPVTKYFCNLKTVKSNPNNHGWKIAHIESVGLGQRGEIREMHIADLEAQFIRFLNPSNMFAVPKTWAGFSEIDEVVTVFKAQMKSPEDSIKIPSPGAVAYAAPERS